MGEMGAIMVAELLHYTDDGMGLDEAIAAYLAACDVEGKSPRTVDAYAETLGMFHAICLQRGLPQRVADFRPAHVYAFLKVIADRGVSLGTRHRRFRETRAFFSWCTRMGGCARSPFTGIPNVKVEQKVIQPLSEEDIQALLALCDAGGEFGCRNRAIILLFLDTGMRSAELHQLTLADVSWENRRIHIRHGKGRKQRVVPFRDGPEAALRAYVEGFRGEDAGRLFLTISRWGEPRRPMNKYLLGTLFTRLGERAGVHANPHRFRHTFSTWAIENAARELDVQYLLGHSTSAMVRRYSATYDAAKAAEAHASFSPEARLLANGDAAG
jgi:site-specific recombinase XerD